MTQKLSLIDEYFLFQNESITKYGCKTITFIEVGSFLEAYETYEQGYNLLEISKLINVIRTKRNNKDLQVNSRNPFMLGFPTTAMVERIKILTDNGITVVIVKELTKPPAKVTRGVSAVYTPGTNILSYTSDVNFIVSIYIKEEQQCNSMFLLNVGLSACDVTTGKVFVYESYSLCDDDKRGLDGALRFIRAHHPKEIIIHLKCQTNKINYSFIKTYLDIEDIPMITIDKIEPQYAKISYQIELFKTIYPNHGMQNPIEYIGIEKQPYTIISYVMLLNYINSINPTVLKKINIPLVFCGEPTLHLENNSLLQLNVFNNNQTDTSTKKIKCLFDVVDNTHTPMGRRYLKSILNSPLVDCDVLQNIYDITEVLIENDNYKLFEKSLSMIGDIEKINRKMIMGIVNIDDLHIFIQSMLIIQTLITDIRKNNKLCEMLYFPSNINRINNLIDFCKKTFAIDKLKNNNSSYYNTGIHTNIDDLYTNLSDKINFIEILQNKLSKLIGKQSAVTTKKNDRDGYYYGITKARANELQEKLKTVSQLTVGSLIVNTRNFEFKPNPVGITKIVVPEINTNSDDIVEIENQIRSLTNEYFASDIKYILEHFGKSIISITKFVSLFDYYISNAKTSTQYNYSKPHIEDCSYGFVSCKQLRHPIIERIIEHEYISHDIAIGTPDLKGILLYGLNSSGKSSMMKAIGMCIIMAQCGMFVPASSFHYSPYNAIFTRISGNDNIFKELSSFSVEMIELKAIWKRADAKTLVIGDEVCRGTEQVSGNAIVAATLCKLSERCSTFIFATHLHDIMKLQCIQNIENIKAFHLSVSFDEKNDRLIFDRLLKKGSGEEIYGITVAKYIIQDNEFTDMSDSIKNELLGTSGMIVHPKPSKYNSGVYVSQCSVCGKKFQKLDNIVNLDTHHIHHQKDCIDGHVIENKSINKNDKSNLVVLCKKCHNNIHNSAISIDKYVSSTSGRVLLSK